MADRDFGAQNPGFMAPLTAAASPIQLPMHYPEGEGGDPGTGGGQPGADPNGAPADKGVGQPQGQGQPAEKVYTSKEDRTDWVPRTRLSEVTTARTRAEQERDQLRQELGREQARVRAALGIEKVDPKTAEKEELKGVLYEMFPQLQTLEGLTQQQLQSVFQAAHSATSATQATWDRHTLSVLDGLDSEVASGMGVESLTQSQSKRLRSAFREEILAADDARTVAVQRGERQTNQTQPGDNDLVARFERGDASLLKEFAKAYLADWFEPARRSVTTSQARRTMRPVPRGERSRSLPASSAKPVDLSNDSEFKKALAAARGGGQE